MIEGEPIESEPESIDISDEVSAIFNSDSKIKSIELMKLLDSKRKIPSLELTLDYVSLNQARWVKAFLEDRRQLPNGQLQKRKAAMRATESQMKEAANIFASGVEWIKVE